MKGIIFQSCSIASISVRCGTGCGGRAQSITRVLMRILMVILSLGAFNKTLLYSHRTTLIRSRIVESRPSLRAWFKPDHRHLSSVCRRLPCGLNSYQIAYFVRCEEEDPWSGRHIDSLDLGRNHHQSLPRGGQPSLHVFPTVRGDVPLHGVLIYPLFRFAGSGTQPNTDVLSLVLVPY